MGWAFLSVVCFRIFGFLENRICLINFDTCFGRFGSLSYVMKRFEEKLENESVVLGNVSSGWSRSAISVSMSNVTDVCLGAETFSQFL